MGSRSQVNSYTVLNYHELQFQYNELFFTIFLNSYSNRQVLVLEGKDRVGGRTLTVDVKTGDGTTDKFDLGGKDYILRILKVF